jgi:hypothetical protein
MQTMTRQVVACGCVLWGTLVHAQDLPDTRGLASQGVDITLLRIATQPGTAQELGLSEQQVREQRAEYNRLNKLNLQLHAKLMRDTSLTEQEQMKQFAKGIEEQNARAEKFMDELLTPAQKTAVLKRYFRERLLEEQMAEIFRDEGMAVYLSLTPEQKRSVVALASELDRQFTQEIVKTRARLLQRVLDEQLSPEQRAKLERLLPAQ